MWAVLEKRPLTRLGMLGGGGSRSEYCGDNEGIML